MIAWFFWKNLQTNIRGIILLHQFLRDQLILVVAPFCLLYLLQVVKICCCKYQERNHLK